MIPDAAHPKLRDLAVSGAVPADLYVLNCRTQTSLILSGTQTTDLAVAFSASSGRTDVAVSLSDTEGGTEITPPLQVPVTESGTKTLPDGTVWARKIAMINGADTRIPLGDRAGEVVYRKEKVGTHDVVSIPLRVKGR